MVEQTQRLHGTILVTECASWFDVIQFLRQNVRHQLAVRQVCEDDVEYFEVSYPLAKSEWAAYSHLFPKEEPKEPAQ